MSLKLVQENVLIKTGTREKCISDCIVKNCQANGANEGKVFTAKMYGNLTNKEGYTSDGTGCNGYTASSGAESGIHERFMFAVEKENGTTYWVPASYMIMINPIEDKPAKKKATPRLNKKDFNNQLKDLI